MSAPTRCIFAIFLLKLSSSQFYIDWIFQIIQERFQLTRWVCLSFASVFWIQFAMEPHPAPSGVLYWVHNRHLPLATYILSTPKPSIDLTVVSLGARITIAFTIIAALIALVTLIMKCTNYFGCRHRRVTNGKTPLYKTPPLLLILLWRRNLSSTWGIIAAPLLPTAVRFNRSYREFVEFHPRSITVPYSVPHCQAQFFELEGDVPGR